MFADIIENSKATRPEKYKPIKHMLCLYLPEGCFILLSTDGSTDVIEEEGYTDRYGGCEMLTIAQSLGTPLTVRIIS